MNKETLKKTPSGASHGLTDDGALVNDSTHWVGGARLVDFDPPLLQIKVWTKLKGWTHIVLDADHNLVAFTGVHQKEEDSFRAMEQVLNNK